MLKITLLVNLMTAVLASPTVHEWHHFKRLHGKQYSNPSEDLLRMQVYMDNKMMIEEHNRRFELGLESFSMKLNHFADMTEHEFHNLYLGLNSSAAVDSSLRGSTFLPPQNAGALPNHVDWRLQGAVTPVKNQGDCGSCWAFSATGALEAQVYRKTKQLISLSEQNLLDCSSYNEFGNKGCEGGLMDNAFTYILYNGGVDTEEAYPYEEMVAVCRYDREKVGASMTGFVNVRQDDERELALAVANAGPVSGGIDASRIGFRFYDSGVFYTPDCDNMRLNHAILIVGYGTENGQDYWLVKNSWGESWGDEGYIKMARNRNNHCGIAKITSYPLV